LLVFAKDLFGAARGVVRVAVLAGYSMETSNRDAPVR
jgi:hypothetical protein